MTPVCVICQLIRVSSKYFQKVQHQTSTLLSGSLEVFPVFGPTKPLREKAILCNDASLGEVTTDFSVHLLWCVLTLSALLWCWWFSWYVCTSTLNLIKLWAKIWKSYGWICLHLNAGPHQTLGFYMEILWLDNCPNKLKFFKIWISSIEVFQQVSLALDRCVLPQDSFCHDLEVHYLSRCSF